VLDHSDLWVIRREFIWRNVLAFVELSSTSKRIFVLERVRVFLCFQKILYKKLYIVSKNIFYVRSWHFQSANGKPDYFRYFHSLEELRCYSKKCIVMQTTSLDSVTEFKIQRGSRNQCVQVEFRTIGLGKSKLFLWQQTCYQYSTFLLQISLIATSVN